MIFHPIIITVVVQHVCNLRSRVFDFLTKLFFNIYSLHYNNITYTNKVKKFLAANFQNFSKIILKPTKKLIQKNITKME